MAGKTLLSWSSGKDSAWALHVLRQNKNIDLCGLFAVVNEKYDRVAMHATRSDLLVRQADAASLPLEIINIPDPCSNEAYAARMREFVENCVRSGVELMAFGDLHLLDIRRYREENLRDTGISPVFPLWQIPTGDLAERMFAAGVRAFISCVDPDKVSPVLAGMQWSKKLLQQLPDNVDPCGENGEFHTVVVDGPFFRFPIPTTIGEIVERDGFVFADVLVTD